MTGKSSSLAVRIEGISKQFKIGATKARYRTFRDVLSSSLSAPFRRAGMILRGEAYGAAALTETIWALRDVSFDVQRGEAVGIIGANGAGKSTLLKILSRITEPTEGEARVYGRVGALLEVGTGFHSELTGRENIYLNAAILGMSRREIERKLDEIIAFAGVEKFIDTPIKHYSSGMGLRLGFAVAAHLEPEILIVDEVLAVGDASFQRKCLGKMGEVAGEGRTVLFVSHNLDAIQSLCSRAVWLQKGQVAGIGPVASVIEQYLTSVSDLEGRGEASFGSSTHRHGNGNARFTRLSLLDEQGEVTRFVRSGSDVRLRLEFEVNVPIAQPKFNILIYDPYRHRLASISTDFSSVTVPAANKGGSIEVCIDRFNLMPGTYLIDLGLAHGQIDLDWIPEAMWIEVLPPLDTEDRVPSSGVVLFSNAWQPDYR